MSSTSRIGARTSALRAPFGGGRPCSSASANAARDGARDRPDRSPVRARRTRRRRDTPRRAPAPPAPARVLPMPPAPTSVTSRVRAQQSRTDARSSSRPIGGPAAVTAGRLPAGDGPAAAALRRRCRQREAIAAAGDRRDRLRAEQLAQRADLHLQVVLLDHHVRPDQVEQLVLGHQALARSTSAASTSKARAPSATGVPVGAQHLARGGAPLEVAEAARQVMHGSSLCVRTQCSAAAPVPRRRFRTFKAAGGRGARPGEQSRPPLQGAFPALRRNAIWASAQRKVGKRADARNSRHAHPLRNQRRRSVDLNEEPTMPRYLIESTSFPDGLSIPMNAEGRQGRRRCSSPTTPSMA